MKNYLSMGLGVNSVAQMLHLLENNMDFEAVYVYMPDWPETHEYLIMLESKGYKIKVIWPKVSIDMDLYNYLFRIRRIPVTFSKKGPIRICTRDFKVNTLQQYFQKPCFSLIGIDYGERKRAKFYYEKGIENRFPLIEAKIDRKECERIIKRHGLPLPMKSGCYFCPYQSKNQWKELRRKHPNLFCKAVQLEEQIRTRRATATICFDGIMIKNRLEEQNRFLFEELTFPPCNCGL